MNILKMLDKIGGLNEAGSNASRRGSLFQFGNFGRDLAKAAVPTTLLAAIPSISRASSSDIIVDTLNFALKLEYLESTFYTMAVSSGVIPSGDAAVFNQIKSHEVTHVAYLQNAITALGGTPDTSPTFDFTAHGVFDPFNNYADFLALSQAFEDTGVRAYKGQAGNLITNNDVLTAALQIHSVEARHAAEVRKIRRIAGDSATKSWITGNNRGTLPAATQPVYNGEDNISQGGVDVSTITSVSTNRITEAFDEPLTMQETLNIAMLFIQ